MYTKNFPKRFWHFSVLLITPLFGPISHLETSRCVNIQQCVQWFDKSACWKIMFADGSPPLQQLTRCLCLPAWFDRGKPLGLSALQNRDIVYTKFDLLPLIFSEYHQAHIVCLCPIALRGTLPPHWWSGDSGSPAKMQTTIWLCHFASH